MINKMVSKPKAYIFDIDGTLSDPSHRVHLYKDKKIDEFNDQCHLDKPFVDVCNICRFLGNADYKIIFLTGRPEFVRVKTEKWINENINFLVSKYSLLMREDGNHEDSIKFKFKQYQKLKDQYNIMGVFEDREHIVKMWRKLGLTCFALPSLFD